MVCGLVGSTHPQRILPLIKMPCYCQYEYEEPQDEAHYDEYEQEDEEGYEEDPYWNMGAAWEQQVMQERYWTALERQRLEAAESARWAEYDEAWDQYKREEYERDAAGWAEQEEALKIEVMKEKAFLEQLEQDEQIQRELESS